MPINDNGSGDDIRREMLEEMHSVDALNINAAVDGAESIPRNLRAAAYRHPSRGGGFSAAIQYHRGEDAPAAGLSFLFRSNSCGRWMSVNNGTVSPLYQSLNQSLNLKVFVAGDKEPLRILSIRSELLRGGSGTLSLVIENNGAEDFENCSAELLAAPPFHVESPDILLGDLSTGSMALASFTVAVDANASLQDYQLGCLIRSGEKSMELSFPLTLTGSGYFPGRQAVLLFGGLIFASLGGQPFLLLKKYEHLYRRKGRRPRLQQFWQRDKGRSRQ